MDDQDSDSADTQPCPHCRTPIYDQASHCPKCGNFISRNDASKHKPIWFIIAAILCLLVVLLLWLR